VVWRGFSYVIAGSDCEFCSDCGEIWSDCNTRPLYRVALVSKFYYLGIATRMLKKIRTVIDTRRIYKIQKNQFICIPLFP
jgi:hypothetical protein